MIKLFSLLFFSIMLFSCESEYQSNLNKMALVAKQNIEDQAFKTNLTVDFLEFTPIKYDTISESFIDTIKLIKLADKINQYNEKSDYLAEILMIDIKLAKNYSSLGWSELFESAKETANDSRKKLSECLDSLQYYETQDSIFRLEIDNRKTEKKYYKFEYYIKATFSENGGEKQSTNLIDTMRLIFNTDFKIFDKLDY